MRRRLRVKLLRTAASKKVTLACFDQGAWTRLRVLNRERWNHEKNDVCRPPFWGPNFGPQNGGHITIFYYDRPHFGVRNSDPKMGSRRSGVFGAGALSKDGFRQQVTQWASACLPVSFLFGRHADSCRQLRIFTNWGGPSQRDRFLRRFSDLILGSSRIASFLEGSR